MQFRGTEEIAAPRSVTWAFLMDPNKVGSCGPGVQSIEVVDDDHFNARAKVGVGFITATFNVNMTFVERIPLEKARISARGQAPGSAVDAIGEMNLRDGPNGSTIMDWSADVNISGTLASVGARLIEGTAHKLIGQSFTCIKTKLQEQAASAPTPAPTKAEAAPVEQAPAAAAAEPTPTAKTAEPTPAAKSAEPTPTAKTAEPTPAAEMAEPTPAARPTPAPAAAPSAAAASPAPTAAPATTAAPAARRTRTGRAEFLVNVAGPAMTNVYVVGDPQTGDAVIVDPAHPSVEWLQKELAARNWHLSLIVLTHGHWDHAGDATAVQNAFASGGRRVQIAAHDGDRALLAARSRTSPFDHVPVVPTVGLADGDRIVFGAIDLEVLHTPGHTDGSVCLRSGSGGILFTGDTLFAGNWGRTDQAGGSATRMVDSLRRLAELPDAVGVFPGHGRSTTIGQERPWLDDVARQGRLTV